MLSQRILFKEAVRDKVLYSLIFFSVLLIGLSVVVDRITIGQSSKIIKDFGLGSISVFGTLISIFMGVGLVFKEIEKKTIFTLIAKPIKRYQFLFGKYLGLLFTLVVEVLLMTFGLVFFLIFFSEGMPGIALFQSIYFIFLELSVITAVAIFFSSFSTPFLSGMFALAIFVIGHLTEDLFAFSVRFQPSGQFMSKVIYYTMPNLEFFNIKGNVVREITISVSHMFWITSYAAMYILALLSLAAMIFQKRDFK